MKDGHMAQERRIAPQTAKAENWLEISGISRKFRETAVLNDVSVTVGRGEILCLVGPSGCGKSTLLRLIAGVDRPDSGRIRLAGDPLCGPEGFVEPEDRAIGFMFQDYALFPHLTAAQNIRFGLRGRPKAEVERLAQTVTERLRIGHLSDRPPHMLSGGEQQRVALARALAPQPRVLLMDEPFSNLDRNLREGLREETLRLLRETGATAVMVTHDPEEALSAGDRVALMRGGRIEQCGAARTLYDHPASAYAAEFFGFCNQLRGTCRGGWIETALGRFPAPGIAEGREGVLYVRPQALSVGAVPGAVEAAVTEVLLMGEIEQITVSVAAHPEPLKLRSSLRRSPALGEILPISAQGPGLFVFAAEAPEGAK